MPKGSNNMDNNLENQLLMMQAMIESKNQDYDEKMKKPAADITGMITSMMYQIKMSKSSPDNKD